MKDANEARVAGLSLEATGQVLQRVDDAAPMPRGPAIAASNDNGHADKHTNGHRADPTSERSNDDGSDSETEWPDPIELVSAAELPTFPVDALPTWLRGWARAEAVATQTPVDLAAMLGLSVLATCCAGKLRICVRADWHEPLNIYVCCVLPPANRKSAVFRDAFSVIETHVGNLITALDAKIRLAASRIKVAEKRLANAINNDARKPAPLGGTSFAVQEAQDEVAEAERGRITPLQLVCGDVTQEALAKLLYEQKERIALIDAEGCGPIALMLGRYSEGTTNVDLYLRGHSGDTHRVDRVNRAPIVLQSPKITLALTVQPEVLRQLGERRELRGLGLLARVLWSLPVSIVGKRNSEPPVMPGEVRAAYNSQVTRLLELPFADSDAPHKLGLHHDAWVALRGLIDRLEPQLGKGGELEYLADWAGKLAGAVARIAGLLHAADHPARPWETEVSAETMQRAIRIGDYLLAHARAALAVIAADSLLEAAQAILEWLRRRRVQKITRRDLFRGLQSRFKKAAELDEPLAMLEERGWLRVEDVRAGGAAKRDVAVIAVNPKAHESTSPHAERRQ